MSKFDHKNIDKAHALISSHIVKTPLVSNDYINEITGGNIFFKLENLQLTGSFKIRGALNKINQLSHLERNNGLVAYSSGNHAQAVAYASKINNINSKIVMPKNAPQIKIQNTRNYGAEVVLYDPKSEKRAREINGWYHMGVSCSSGEHDSRKVVVLSEIVNQS